MGCDVHLHTEVKIDGKWEHYGAPNVQRNYALFTKMAGVRRRDDVTPIAEPKGLPEDISVVTRVAWGRDKDDAHSMSWLDANEILELEQWHYDYMQDFFAEREWGYFFDNSWGGFVRYPGSTPPDIEDIRFVFWFDN